MENYWWGKDFWKSGEMKLQLHGAASSTPNFFLFLTCSTHGHEVSYIPHTVSFLHSYMFEKVGKWNEPFKLSWWDGSNGTLQSGIPPDWRVLVIVSLLIESFDSTRREAVHLYGTCAIQLCVHILPCETPPGWTRRCFDPSIMCNAWLKGTNRTVSLRRFDWLHSWAGRDFPSLPM